MPLIDSGMRAPNFSVQDQNGKSRSLKDYGGRTLVMVFYAKDDSALCAAEACQFRDAMPDLTKIKATVIGICPATPESHARFDAKHTLGFPLLADAPNGDGTPRVCDAYGVWTGKTMYGRAYMGVRRTTYLIGPDGAVVRRWDNVRVPGHAAEVLAAVRALHSGEMIEPKPERRRERTAAQRSARAHRSASKKTRSHDSNPQFTPARGSRMAVVSRPSQRGTRSGGP